MSKSIGQVAYESWIDNPAVAELVFDSWKDATRSEKIAATSAAKALLAHAASHLRYLGEQEKTYALQDCMERAARAIEEME